MKKRPLKEIKLRSFNTGNSFQRLEIILRRAPHNSAVQIYDFKEKKSRVVFGPELVLLGPDEHFTGTSDDFSHLINSYHSFW